MWCDDFKSSVLYAVEKAIKVRSWLDQNEALEPLVIVNGGTSPGVYMTNFRTEDEKQRTFARANLLFKESKPFYVIFVSEASVMDVKLGARKDAIYAVGLGPFGWISIVRYFHYTNKTLILDEQEYADNTTPEVTFNTWIKPWWIVPNQSEVVN